MSLLEIITKASAEAPPSEPGSEYPIILNPEPVLFKLKPESDYEGPVKRVDGWEIWQTDRDAIEYEKEFYIELKEKLKNRKSFGKGKFLEIFTSYLEKSGERFGIPVIYNKGNDGYIRVLVEKLGFLMGRDVKGLILEACISLECWDVIEYFIVHGFVEHLLASKLVHALIEKNRLDLLVLFVQYHSDIQSNDLMRILKVFLLPPKDAYKSMVTVKDQWESQGVLAIEKIRKKEFKGKKMRLLKEAAILLMVAHDGFLVKELCLHYLLASRNFDDVIFGACISKLNGQELMALIRYLGKWLRKYERFPQVVPCPKASMVLGLKACDWVPSFENVVKCLGLVVDEHFSSLVLHSEFHEELRSLDGVVHSLAAEARFCVSLENLAERLRSKQIDD